MSKTGRKTKYFSHVEPYLDEISEWCRTMTEAQIAKKLGVAYRSFCDYKNKYPQLMQALKKGRQDLVVELKSTLISKAKGYMYEEVKVITDSDGYEKKEIIKKYSHPDVAAINLLLKNYDKENWANDPQMIALRKKELELKEKQIEANIW